MGKVSFIFTLGVLLLQSNLLQAKSNKWKKLEDVEMHPAKAYHLKPDVEVLEIRSYYPKRSTESYRPDIDIYVKDENKIAKKRLSSFKKAKANFSRKSNIAYPPDARGKTSRAFVLYNDGKISRMNEISDVVKLMGTIDTAAEAQLVLYLHAVHRSKATKSLKGSKVHTVSVKENRIRAVSNGYEIETKYRVVATKKGSRNEMSSIELYRDIVARSFVTKKGKIKRYKILSRSKIEEEKSTIISL